MVRLTVPVGTLALVWLATMMPALGQPADPVAADLARDWADQKQRMVALAEAMPAERYDFKATPPQRTFAEQLVHLAEAHLRMLRALDPGGRVPVPAVGHPRSRQEVVAALAAAYDYGQQVIALAAPVSERAGERTRARVVWAAMNNAMNHYGQCVVYLRLNGIVPPASRQ
ncbi:MAG TPA: DinB family protein [Vicinamibacterales bacterium]|nr:DinB family protein [Vicinamibacterales bacterium]